MDNISPQPPQYLDIKGGYIADEADNDSDEVADKTDEDDDFLVLLQPLQFELPFSYISSWCPTVTGISFLLCRAVFIGGGTFFFLLTLVLLFCTRAVAKTPICSGVGVGLTTFGGFFLFPPSTTAFAIDVVAFKEGGDVMLTYCSMKLVLLL